MAKQRETKQEKEPKDKEKESEEDDEGEDDDDDAETSGGDVEIMKEQVGLPCLKQIKTTLKAFDLDVNPIVATDRDAHNKETWKPIKDNLLRNGINIGKYFSLRQWSWGATGRSEFIERVLFQGDKPESYEELALLRRRCGDYLMAVPTEWEDCTVEQCRQWVEKAFNGERSKTILPTKKRERSISCAMPTKHRKKKSSKASSTSRSSSSSSSGSSFPSSSRSSPSSLILRESNLQ